jgi:hypothetical protein
MHNTILPIDQVLTSETKQLLARAVAKQILVGSGNKLRGDLKEGDLEVITYMTDIDLSAWYDLRVVDCSDDSQGSLYNHLWTTFYNGNVYHLFNYAAELGRVEIETEDE